MRQSLISALILVCGATCASELSAQEVYFGALGGPSFTSIAWTPEPAFDVTNKTSASGGAFLGIDLNESVGIEGRLMLVRTSVNLNPNVPGLNATGEARVDFVSVPLLVKLRLGSDGVRPFVVAGPELGFKTGSRLQTTINGVTEDDTEFDDGVASNNLSLDIGGGVEIPVGRVSVILEGLYSHGLKDLADDPAEDVEQIKTRSFRVSVGLRF